MAPKKKPVAAKATAKTAAKAPAKPSAGKKTTPAKTEKKQEEEKPRGVSCALKEMEEVLLKDTDGKIAADGRWPLVIDQSGNVATYLRYQNSNYLSAVTPSDMEPETIRRALLGAIRYGKPLVVDMLEVDMFETVSMRFDEVLQGLMNHIIDKSIMNEDKYLSVVRDSDGPEYDKHEFDSDRVNQFKFILITKMAPPPPNLVEITYPITVMT